MVLSSRYTSKHIFYILLRFEQFIGDIESVLEKTSRIIYFKNTHFHLSRLLTHLSNYHFNMNEE